jgi:hypothetical protein
MSDRKVFELSDELIGQLAKLLQLSILTGTNVVDHFRLLRVETEEGKLTLTPEYKEYFENSLNSMLKEAEQLQEEMQTTIVQA